MGYTSNKVFEQCLLLSLWVLWLVLFFYVNFIIANTMFWTIIVISKLIYQYFGIASHPDVLRTDQQIIESRGYAFEEHVAKTEDDYYLTMHRIVNPLIKEMRLPVKPILFMHGMGGCSSNWIVTDDDGYLDKELIKFGNDLNASIEDDKVENTLAFALANRGYDVWLGNFRGTALSNKHVKYSEYDGEYWDYTVDHLMEHDLPTMIDYVLETTGKDKIGYIGFSQGSTAVFGLLASKPEYNEKLKPLIAMTPVTQTKNTFSFIPTELKPYIAKIISRVLLYSNGNIMPLFLYKVRKWMLISHPFTWITKTIAPCFVGLLKCREFNVEHSETLMSRDFGRVSKKLFVHVLQINVRGIFARFDYGKELNQQHYDQDEPPEYDTENITNEYMVFMCARNDTLVNLQDSMTLRHSLTVPLLDFYIVPNDNWNHFDFQFGRNVGQFVNKKVLGILLKMEYHSNV